METAELLKKLSNLLYLDFLLTSIERQKKFFGDESFYKHTAERNLSNVVLIKSIAEHCGLDEPDYSKKDEVDYVIGFATSIRKERQVRLNTVYQLAKKSVHFLDWQFVVQSVRTNLPIVQSKVEFTEKLDETLEMGMFYSFLGYQRRHFESSLNIPDASV
jgi:hypothetical protein